MTHYKFHYFGDRSAAYSNVITVATMVDGDKIKAGFSFCNKKDKYVKKVGRFLAIENLHKSPVILDPQEWENTYPFGRYRYLRCLIANYLATTYEKAPSWVEALVEYEAQEYYWYFSDESETITIPSYLTDDDEVYGDELADAIDFGDAELKPTLAQKVAYQLRKIFA